MDNSDNRTLSPLDIRYQEFRSSLRGYATNEVRDYLQKTADRLSAVLDEHERLKHTYKELEQKLAQSQADEADLKRAVVAAERIARDIKTQAEKEAELIKREAEAERQMILQDAQDSIKTAKDELLQLVKNRDLFVAQFRAMLDTYGNSLQKFK